MDLSCESKWWKVGSFEFDLSRIFPSSKHKEDSKIEKIINFIIVPLPSLNKLRRFILYTFLIQHAINTYLLDRMTIEMAYLQNLHPFQQFSSSAAV